MCNVNLLLQMSYTYKIDEIEKCLNDADGCMMVSHRMLQKQFFTDDVRMTAAASMAEGREILKSVRPLLKSLRCYTDSCIIAIVGVDLLKSFNIASFRRYRGLHYYQSS